MAGVSDRPILKCGTLSPSGLLRPRKTLFTLLVGCAVFLRWFLALILAQNGGDPQLRPTAASLGRDCYRRYLPLFAAFDKLMNRLF